jgi:hypothetical protein
MTEVALHYRSVGETEMRGQNHVTPYVGADFLDFGSPFAFINYIQSAAVIMSETFSTIPIIDWRRLQDPETKAAALDQLREAIFVVGFLYLTNHGLEVRKFSLQYACLTKSGIDQADSCAAS